MKHKKQLTPEQINLLTEVWVGCAIYYTLLPFALVGIFLMAGW